MAWISLACTVPHFWVDAFTFYGRIIFAKKLQHHSVRFVWCGDPARMSWNKPIFFKLTWHALYFMAWALTFGGNNVEGKLDIIKIFSSLVRCSTIFLKSDVAKLLNIGYHLHSFWLKGLGSALTHSMSTDLRSLRLSCFQHITAISWIIKKLCQSHEFCQTYQPMYLYQGLSNRNFDP